jgi:hypothetical protein
MMNNALWIPERAVELQIRLCAEAHSRSAIHRAHEETLGESKEYVAWTTMAKDVKVVVQNWLDCVINIPGDKVPRQLGTRLHETKPKEILHFDFLCIWLSRDGKYQYLLLLKDDLNGYRWLVPCRPADAAATVDALMCWYAVFDVVLLCISHRCGHFKNEVVRRVQKELKSKHPSFHYGELPVVKRHYRVRMQANHSDNPCSTIRAKDIRRRVTRSG